MSKRIILSSVLGLALFCQSSDSFSVNWPIIDSYNEYKPFRHVIVIPTDNLLKKRSPH